MTVEASIDLTICDTIDDQEILTEFEATFDSFRSRIAMVSCEASAVLTSMFLPLGPVEFEVIDIDAIEWEQLELEVVSSERPAVLELELAAIA